MPAPTVSEIFEFSICYLENVGQGNGVQLSQWFHSMENINICTHNYYAFAVKLFVLEILTFQFLTLKMEEKVTEHNIHNMRLEVFQTGSKNK